MPAATAAQAINDADDRVQLAALHKLAARLEEETDPVRLERLLAIALRVRRCRRTPTSDEPQASTPSRSPLPAGKRECGQGLANPGDSSLNAASQQPASPQVPLPLPRTNAPRPPSTGHQDELEFDSLPRGPATPLPTFHPMTDDEFHKLFKEVGLNEAQRQRIIRATLVSEQRNLTNSS